MNYSSTFSYFLLDTFIALDMAKKMENSSDVNDAARSRGPGAEWSSTSKFSDADLSMIVTIKRRGFKIIHFEISLFKENMVYRSKYYFTKDTAFIQDCLGYIDYMAVENTFNSEALSDAKMILTLYVA
jgi:hypothetical protein